jgi:hypothetical protein
VQQFLSEGKNRLVCHNFSEGRSDNGVCLSRSSRYVREGDNGQKKGKKKIEISLGKLILGSDLDLEKGSYEICGNRERIHTMRICGC